MRAKNAFRWCKNFFHSTLIVFLLEDERIANYNFNGCFSSLVL